MVLKNLKRYVDDLICEHGEEYPCVSWTRLVEWTSISDNIMDNCTNLEELLAEMIQYWEADKAEQLLSQEVASGKYDNTDDSICIERLTPKVGAKENTSFGIIRTFITNKAGVRRDIQLVSSSHYDEKYCCMVCTYLVQGVSEYTIVSEDTNSITTGFDFADGPMYTVGGEFSNGVYVVGNILELKSFQPNAKGLVCCHLVVESK